MENSNVIVSIGTAPATYSYLQEELLDFMQTEYADNITNRKLNILFKQSGIKTRHSVLPDFNLHSEEIKLLNKDNIPSIEKRLDVFKTYALPMATRAIDNALDNIRHQIKINRITHLLTVSCTGIYAPGLGNELIDYYKLPITTFQTGINFMGCNAVFTALRIADSIAAKDKNAVVLVVSVELCTLHFRAKSDNDNLLANTIFSDGAAAAIVTNKCNIRKINGPVFEIGDFGSITLSKGSKLMAWNVNSINFEMVLSGEVPGFISDNILSILQTVFAGPTVKNDDNLVWAVHPGGKKILDFINKIIPEKNNSLLHSYRTLENFGNMSSATILFVLFRILNEVKKNDSIICIGFGPGMSIDTLLLSKTTSDQVEAEVNLLTGQIQTTLNKNDLLK